MTPIEFVDASSGTVAAGIEKIKADAASAKGVNRILVFTDSPDGSYTWALYGEDMSISRLLLFAKELELWAERAIEATRKKP